MHETFDRPASREQRWGYAVLRAFLGICFWAHALFLVALGPGLGELAHHMLFSMAETHLPNGLILLFGYAQPGIDLLLGAFLLLGVKTSSALGFSFLYLCVLTLNYALDVDPPSVLITIGATLAVAFLLVGRKRFDTSWHVLVTLRRTAA